MILSFLKRFVRKKAEGGFKMLLRQDVKCDIVDDGPRYMMLRPWGILGEKVQ